MVSSEDLKELKEFFLAPGRSLGAPTSTRHICKSKIIHLSLQRVLVLQTDLHCLRVRIYNAETLLSLRIHMLENRLVIQEQITGIQEFEKIPFANWRQETLSEYF